MPAPNNPFKSAIHAGEMQIGCWLGLAEPYLAEISGSAGFDWVVVDCGVFYAFEFGSNVRLVFGSIFVVCLLFVICYLLFVICYLF